MRRRLKDNTKVLIVDLEATCWEDKEFQDKNSEVLEIGVVCLDLVTGTIIDKEYYLIKTKSEISPYCTKLTGITQELVDNEGITLQKASKLIRTRFKTKNIAWGGWGDDYTELETECDKKNAVFPFSDHYHDIGQHFCWAKGLKRGINLSKALTELGLEFKGTPHRALPDAENTARIFLKVFQGRDL